ncbi:hypothetical protein PGTUg99_008998 [Puccinia graminis f. sp. tritici]|uniref:Uncharacterized protein n=1 Tax=Puccinia graminis f. sp. tritici TaxID=56615 RepID=A0A5B0LNJ0_PUCGR|nr:hypothetical protein PGTUg99_008998 [Puccinia graminis f. sp. tritici]
MTLRSRSRQPDSRPALPVMPPVGVCSIVTPPCRCQSGSTHSSDRLLSCCRVDHPVILPPLVRSAVTGPSSGRLSCGQSRLARQAVVMDVVVVDQSVTPPHFTLRSWRQHDGRVTTVVLPRFVRSVLCLSFLVWTTSRPAVCMPPMNRRAVMFDMIVVINCPFDTYFTVRTGSP